MKHSKQVCDSCGACDEPCDCHLPCKCGSGKCRGECTCNSLDVDPDKDELEAMAWYESLGNEAVPTTMTEVLSNLNRR